MGEGRPLALPSPAQPEWSRKNNKEGRQNRKQLFRKTRKMQVSTKKLKISAAPSLCEARSLVLTQELLAVKV